MQYPDFWVPVAGAWWWWCVGGGGRGCPHFPCCAANAALHSPHTWPHPPHPLLCSPTPAVCPSSPHPPLPSACPLAAARPARWQAALIATCATLAGSALLGILLIYVAPPVLAAGRGQRAAALQRLLAISSAQLSRRLSTTVSDGSTRGSRSVDCKSLDKEAGDLENRGSQLMEPANSSLPRSLVLVHDNLALASVLHHHPGVAELAEVLRVRPQTGEPEERRTSSPHPRRLYPAVPCSVEHALQPR